MNYLANELDPNIALTQACEALGVARSSVHYRRCQKKTTPLSTRPRKTHPRALSSVEHERILDLLNSEAYAEQPPAQVYASELDEGRYHCSIRTMQRILKAHGQSGERRPQREPTTHAVPRLVATRPNEVWVWDITKCATLTPGVYLSVYVMMDLFSRYIVAWMVSMRENSRLARQLIEESMLRYEIAPGQLTLHQDRGPPMTANQFIDMLIDQKVTPSHSRPRVSNDNPFIESHFRTSKSQPDYPGRFTGARHGRRYWGDFVNWYNNDHHHRGIALYTPSQVFTGAYATVHQSRTAALSAAYSKYPERFVRGMPTAPILPESVVINPTDLLDNDNEHEVVNFPTLKKVRERLSVL
jgi:putative transposase